MKRNQRNGQYVLDNLQKPKNYYTFVMLIKYFGVFQQVLYICMISHIKIDLQACLHACLPACLPACLSVCLSVWSSVDIALCLKHDLFQQRQGSSECLSSSSKIYLSACLLPVCLFLFSPCLKHYFNSSEFFFIYANQAYCQIM